jgi:tripartite-type tricarboxylate transporter receptor subunit TctC
MRGKGSIAVGLCAGLLFLGWVLEGAPRAQDYPVKPITVIVAYAAGGGTDIAARLINQFAEKYLKQPLVVVNKPGAGAEIGFTELARSRPDGYTIGWLNTPTIMTVPIQRKAAFSLDDFFPICNIIYDPGVLVVRSDSSLNTVEKVVAEAKKNPGVLTYGTTGIGSDDHLAALALEREAGIKLIHVPFDGTGPSTIALLGGHINLLLANEGEMLPHVRSGKAKVVAVMNEKRIASLPDVPTFRERGINVISSSARGVGAPKGMPAPIVKKLEETFFKANNEPEFIKKAKELELPLYYLDSKAYSEYLRSLDASYRALWAKQPWVK